MAPHTQNVLVTGGSGFFGSILKRRLLAEGHSVVNIDLEQDDDRHERLTSIRGDIRDRGLVQQLFTEHRFEAVYHCAAQLAHGAKVDEQLLWTSNVDGTRILAEAAAAAGCRPFVFISSNCLWAEDLGHPVHETRDLPAPVELYGRSKLAGEELLKTFGREDGSGPLDVVTLRCPTIMEAGRLGLLAILYEFIDDAKTVWVVGDGGNRYQFIYADDLANACLLAARYAADGHSDLFHIGSDDVRSMRDVYEAVIAQAAAEPASSLSSRPESAPFADAVERPASAPRRSARTSRVRSLPKAPTLALMQLAHKLRLSPLGPYHYKMIASNFVFDTSRIKEKLGWRPTLTNEQMLLRAYAYYREHRKEIAARTGVSAHRRPASMGIIRLLKWLS